MVVRQHALSPESLRRRVTWIAGLLGFLITVPSFWVGLVGDDYVHRTFLLDHLHSPASKGVWWNMFENPEPLQAQVSFGALPWWTSPHLRVALFRPLATLSQYVDYLLWPEHPVWMHVHNSLVYALTVSAVAALYLRLLPAPAAMLGAVLYAVDDAHALGTAWIAGRNTLLTALFGVLTLHAFLSARETGSKRFTLLAVCTLLLSHASSEGAVSVWAYIVAYELFLSAAPVRERLRSLLPLAAASGAWLLFTGLQHYGVKGSGAYLDPRVAPAHFVSEMGHRFPKLLAMQFGLAGELTSFVTPLVAHVSSAAALVLLAALALYAVRDWKRDPVLRFWLFGCMFSLLPICAVGAVGRVLFLSGVGAHALIAQLFMWSTHKALGASASRMQARTLRAVAISVLTLQTLSSVYGAIAAPTWWLSMHRYIYTVARSLPSGKGLETSAIMVLNARDYLATPFVMLYRRLFCMPGPIIVHVLGVSTEALTVKRLDDVSIELTPDQGYLADATSILVRPRTEPFTTGQVIDLFGARIQVEELTPDARPARIKLNTFGVDDARLLWVVWDDAERRYVRVQMPRPGESLAFPALPNVNTARPFSMLN